MCSRQRELKSELKSQEFAHENNTNNVQLCIVMIPYLLGFDRQMECWYFYLANYPFSSTAHRYESILKEETIFLLVRKCTVRTGITPSQYNRLLSYLPVNVAKEASCKGL
jgi:hypothetical protein